MADAKITALEENVTPLSTDLIPMVDDPGGTPVTQKVQLANLPVSAATQTALNLKSSFGLAVATAAGLNLN